MLQYAQCSQFLRLPGAEPEARNGAVAALAAGVDGGERPPVQLRGAHAVLQRVVRLAVTRAPCRTQATVSTS